MRRLLLLLVAVPLLTGCMTKQEACTSLKRRIQQSIVNHRNEQSIDALQTFYTENCK